MLRFLAFLLLVFAAACASTPPPHPPSPATGSASRCVGSGPDVVLIPGLSSSPEVWDSTIAAVPGYRYHLVHVSGFAGRPAGANAQGPVLAPVAEEIARYISEARLERPAIVGHSMGGSWAMMVAGRHPELGLAGDGGRHDAVHGRDVRRPQRDAGQRCGRWPSRSARAWPPRRAPARRADRRADDRLDGEDRIASRRRDRSSRWRAIPTVSAQGFYDLIVTDLRPDLANIRVPLTVLYVLPQGAPLTAEQIDQFYAASYANAPQAVRSAGSRTAIISSCSTSPSSSSASSGRFCRAPEVKCAGVTAAVTPARTGPWEEGSARQLRTVRNSIDTIANELQ